MDSFPKPQHLHSKCKSSIPLFITLKKTPYLTTPVPVISRVVPYLTNHPRQKASLSKNTCVCSNKLALLRIKNRKFQFSKMQKRDLFN